MNETIIGIDLGTTNSEVAVVISGEAKVISQNDEIMLPSVVGLGDDGALLVGTSAKNQYTLYPERTIRSVKRYMGTDTQFPLGTDTYFPQEVSAMILKRLKNIAEDHLGQPVQKAVITVPAYFSDAQRQATKEAGEIAGLEVVRMINEPTAAALAYDASEKEHKKVLIYDLGGGTFDVSVVSMQQNVIEVLSSHGNNHLGGDDFDEKIFEAIQSHLMEQGVDIAEDSKAVARVVRAAEKAKITLSDHPFARIEEEYLTTKKGHPIHLSFELSREHYEALIGGYIDETLESVHTALKDANLTVSDIDDVILVGGSTRTPLIQKRLASDFNLTPRAEVNPDLCVAMGAAIQAALMSGESVASSLVDITPYTFGTSALSELNGEHYPYRFVPIIKKNSPIPVSKSDVFYTAHDGQKAVDVMIYQGEDQDALNNILIGEFTVEGLQDTPANNPIVLALNLDLNGILTVTATEKNTGLKKSITINNAMSRFDDQQIDAAKNRIDALLDDKQCDKSSSHASNQEATTKEHQVVVQANALKEKANSLLPDLGEDDQEDMIDQIEAINDAIKANDMNAIKIAMDELSDLIYYVET